MTSIFTTSDKKGHCFTLRSNNVGNMVGKMSEEVPVTGNTISVESQVKKCILPCLYKPFEDGQMSRLFDFEQNERLKLDDLISRVNKISKSREPSEISTQLTESENKAISNISKNYAEIKLYKFNVKRPLYLADFRTATINFSPENEEYWADIIKMLQEGYNKFTIDGYILSLDDEIVMINVLNKDALEDPVEVPFIEVSEELITKSNYTLENQNKRLDTYLE
jgi:hypothetical protein